MPLRSIVNAATVFAALVVGVSIAQATPTLEVSGTQVEGAREMEGYLRKAGGNYMTLGRWEAERVSGQGDQVAVIENDHNDPLKVKRTRTWLFNGSPNHDLAAVAVRSGKGKLNVMYGVDATKYAAKAWNDSVASKFRNKGAGVVPAARR